MRIRIRQTVRSAGFYVGENCSLACCWITIVGRGHLHYGMIATGNHLDFDSLRDAPPRRRTIIIT